MPAVSVEMVQVAWSALTLTLPQPGMSVLPSWKSTVPLAPDGEIVAVKVTESPRAEGFSEVSRLVVVVIRKTLCSGASVPLEL
jgi:hypothetical protein